MEKQKKDMLLRLLNRLSSPLRLAVVKSSRLKREAAELETAGALLELHARSAGRECGRSLQGMVFSKDRALQLHGLLGSYFEQVEDPAPLTVLYAASSPAHREAYRQVFEIFKSRPVKAVFEDGSQTFKEKLTGLLDQAPAERVFFLVDDMLFIRPVKTSELLDFDPRNSILSLRLGANLTTSYTTQKSQPLPDLRRLTGSGLLEFDWQRGRLDWAYPLSLDGHLFWAPELRALAKLLDYRSPNTLEDALQLCLPLFRWRPGRCYPQSRTLNIPANRVQQDNQNLHGDVHQDGLLREWQAGKQMDYRALYDFDNVSCHQEVEIRLITRPLAPGEK